ncbi:MAG: glycosyltransferase family 1 protein [Deltaproteobacteria bacterium]|nr:MAG: glycosyltransferase family 1 protein [Deltaproteobacteria bacterium]
MLPDLFDHVGGIARISRATVLACHQHAERRGYRLTVHALRDTGHEHDETYLPAPSRYRAYNGSRARLAAAVLASAHAPGHAATIFGHVNLATLGLLFPPRLAWPPRSRYAVILHGIEVWSPLPRARRAALRFADALWPISHFTGDRATTLHGVERARLRIIPNCLDPSFTLADDDAAARRDTPPYFLAVTRLEPNTPKGVDHTIAAFAQAAPDLPEGTRLVIAGAGDDHARLARLANVLGVGEQVELAGRVSAQRLDALFRGCLAFVLPSANEGFGLVFVEAMSQARPVIAAGSGGTTEVVVHGKTGVLVDYGDVVAIAREMTALASNPDRATQLGAAGLARVRRRFTFERYAGDIAGALDHLVPGSL